MNTQTFAPGQAAHLPWTVHYDGAGTYEPHVEQGQTHWRRNDADPWVGVRIDSLAAAFIFGGIVIRRGQVAI